MQSGYLREFPIVRLSCRMAADEEYCWRPPALAAPARHYASHQPPRHLEYAGAVTQPSDSRCARLGVLGTLWRAAAGLGLSCGCWDRSERQIEAWIATLAIAPLGIFLRAPRAGLPCAVNREHPRYSHSGEHARLPQGAHVINIGRGAPSVEADLLLAGCRHLGGARWMVFPESRCRGQPVVAPSAVLITPHVFGITLRRNLWPRSRTSSCSSKRCPLTDVWTAAKGIDGTHEGRPLLQR